MTTRFAWYIVGKDGKRPWEPSGTRAVDLRYLQQVAIATDRLGYECCLMASGVPDGWVLSTALAAVTERVRFLVATYPGLTSPTQLAKMVISFQQLFGDRVLINVVNGEDPLIEQHGIFLDKDSRYELSREYWGLVKRLVAGDVVDHQGRFYSLKNAGARLHDFEGSTYPLELWFGGSSDAALRSAAGQVDRYLSWAEPPAVLAEKLNRVRQLFAGSGREVTFGLRVPLIVRDTEEEAWRYADELLRSTSADVRAQRLDALRNGGSNGGRSEGVSRAFRLIEDRAAARARDLEVYPNLWAGDTLLHGGPPISIVGSTAQVVERLKEYEALGIDRFIVSGYPLLEEAYRVAETVLPAFAASRERTHVAA